jgi:hypothetical protein
MNSWEEELENTRKMKDGNERVVDEKVVDIVTILNLIGQMKGFKTCASCEGHLSEGLPYPWINMTNDKCEEYGKTLMNLQQMDDIPKRKELKK